MTVCTFNSKVTLPPAQSEMTFLLFIMVKNFLKGICKFEFVYNNINLLSWKVSLNINTWKLTLRQTFVTSILVQFWFEKWGQSSQLHQNCTDKVKSSEIDPKRYIFSIEFSRLKYITLLLYDVLPILCTKFLRLMFKVFIVWYLTYNLNLCIYLKM